MRTPFLAPDYTGRGTVSRPLGCGGRLFHDERKEEPLLGTSVSAIDRYPLRSEGFEEPLFPTVASKRAVAEHLLEAPWLKRASELKGTTGEITHVFEEPVEIGRDLRGRWQVVRLTRGRRKRCSWRRRRVVRVLDRWREIRGWWDENESVDWTIFRLVLSGDAVVEVARERSGGWLLVGTAD